jgi:hypothetical protein
MSKQVVQIIFKARAHLQASNVDGSVGLNGHLPRPCLHSIYLLKCGLVKRSSYCNDNDVVDQKEAKVWCSLFGVFKQKLLFRWARLLAKKKQQFKIWACEHQCVVVNACNMGCFDVVTNRGALLAVVSKRFAETDTHISRRQGVLKKRERSDGINVILGSWWLLRLLLHLS